MPMNPEPTSRRCFLQRCAVLCMAAIAVPDILGAASAANASASASTLVSVIPGEITEDSRIESILKGINGVEQARYDSTYKFVRLSYQPEKNKLAAIVENARKLGVNIQRLRCDKRAPYCNRQCQLCPAKKREF